MEEQDRIKIKTFVETVKEAIRTEGFKPHFREFVGEHNAEFEALWGALLKLWHFSLSPEELQAEKLKRRDEEGVVKGVMHKLKNNFPDYFKE